MARNEFDAREADEQSVYEDAQSHIESDGGDDKQGLRFKKEVRRGLRRLVKKADKVLDKAHLGTSPVTEDVAHKQQDRLWKLRQSESIVDAEAGTSVKMDSALGGLAQRLVFKESDPSSIHADRDGNVTTSKEEKFLFGKSVDYDHDKKNKTISRGTRDGELFTFSYTKDGDGKPTLNDFKIGPLSYSRQKGPDGSSNNKIAFGKLFSFAREVDAHGNRSSTLKITGQFSKKKTLAPDGKALATYLRISKHFSSDWKRDDAGATEKERKFTNLFKTRIQRDADGNETYSRRERLGKTTEFKKRADGTSIELSSRGTRLDQLERMTPQKMAAVLAKDMKNGKVRNFTRKDEAGNPVESYKKSRFGYRNDNFKMGSERDYDFASRRRMGGVKSDRTLTVSQAQKNAAEANLKRTISDIVTPSGWRGDEVGIRTRLVRNRTLTEFVHIFRSLPPVLKYEVLG